MTIYGNKWLSENVQNLNFVHFKGVNEKYLKTVGEQHYRNLVVKLLVSEKQ